MNGITVSMAIIDFIPVVFFFASMVYLQIDLYRHMIKPAFAMLASGSFLVLWSLQSHLENSLCIGHL